MRRLAAVLAAGVLLAGCGGSEGEVESAVNDYSNAFFSGEGIAAYNLLSSECRDTVSQEDFVMAVGFLSELIGDEKPEITTFSIDSINGNDVTVSYGYDLGNGDYDQTSQPWVRESGGWRYDDCR